MPVSYRIAMNALAGTWVEVETDFLFKDQFNVKDLRIYLHNVDEIRDDMRRYRKQCLHCNCQEI